jgi:DNA-binding Xre family transcriptional regulator
MLLCHCNSALVLFYGIIASFVNQGISAIVENMLRLKVKEVAISKGFNQSTLSRASNVPIDTIRRIWRNPYYEVRFSTLNKIAAVLGVPATELIEDVAE